MQSNFETRAGPKAIQKILYWVSASYFHLMWSYLYNYIEGTTPKLQGVVLIKISLE